tara:strand:- start:111 stop:446 length:336 start_codon:yes stop_codon:yes gene_type:complete
MVFSALVPLLLPKSYQKRLDTQVSLIGKIAQPETNKFLEKNKNVNKKIKMKGLILKKYNFFLIINKIILIKLPKNKVILLNIRYEQRTLISPIFDKSILVKYFKDNDVKKK